MHCPKIIKGYFLWIKACVLYMCVCLTHTHTHTLTVYFESTLCVSHYHQLPHAINSVIYNLHYLRFLTNIVNNQNGIFLFSLEQQLDHSLFNCSLQQTTKNIKHKKWKEEDIPAQNCSIFIVQFQFNLKQPYLLFNHFISLVIVPSSLRRLTYSSQPLFHFLFSANSFGPHFLLVPWLYFLFGCFWDS